MIQYIERKQNAFYIFLGITFGLPIILHIMISPLSFAARIGNIVASFIDFSFAYIFLRLMLYFVHKINNGNNRMERWLKLATEFFIVFPLLALFLGLWWQVEYFMGPEKMIAITIYGPIGMILAAYHHWCKYYNGITYFIRG